MNNLKWTSPDEQMIALDGALISTSTWGPPPDEAMTFVLLHEGLGSVAMWRDFPERLSASTGLGVLAYSRQGYGNSSPCVLPRPLDYMEREATQVLPKMLDAAGIKRCILLGHSDGGSIAALHQAHVNDPRVRGLILVAPHFFVEDISVESIDIVRTAWRGTDLPQRLSKYHADAENAFLGWNQAWLDPDFRDWDITDCLAAIEVPVLALQGTTDDYGTAAQVEIIGKRSNAPSEIHLIEECGHSPFKDQPVQTLDLITSFAARLTASESTPAQ